MKILNMIFNLFIFNYVDALLNHANKLTILASIIVAIMLSKN